MSTKTSHKICCNDEIYELLQENEDENIEVPTHLTALIKREANRQKKEKEVELARHIAEGAMPTDIDWKLEDLPEGFEVFDEED